MEDQVAMNKVIAKAVAEATRVALKQSQKYKVRDLKAKEDPI